MNILSIASVTIILVLVGLQFKGLSKLVFASIVLLFILLPIFFKSFRFNLITGGENLLAASPTKKEAIERGVYVCDLSFPFTPYKTNDSITLDMTEGWVEKSWRGGYWYWTTIENPVGYSIRVISPDNAKDKQGLIIRYHKSSGVNYEGLAYGRDRFAGMLNELPTSDTLRYYMLRKNKLVFDEEDIIGSIELVLVMN